MYFKEVFLFLFVFIIPFVFNLAESQSDDGNNYHIPPVNCDKSYYYAVYFKDKRTHGYELSTKAYQRRERQGISLQEEDRPVNQEYLFQLKEKGVKVSPVYVSRWRNMALVSFPSKMEEEILKLPFVDRIFQITQGSLREETERYQAPWHSIKETIIHESLKQNRFMGLDEVQDEGFFGSNKLVFIIDFGFSGVNNNEVFDKQRIIETFDWEFNSENIYRDGEDHGTNVLSTMLGYVQDGSKEYIGSAIGANYVLYEIGDGIVSKDDIKAGKVLFEYLLLFAVENADVKGADLINISMGIDERSPIYNPELKRKYTNLDIDGVTSIASWVVTKAASKGIIITVAAGNEGNTSNPVIGIPSDAKNIICVGALSDVLTKSSFSSVGPTADGRMAPFLSTLGSQVSVFGKNGNVLVNGTSFASPQLLGFTATLLEMLEVNYPDVHPTVSQCLEALRLSADNVSAPNNNIGNGTPHIKRAYEKLKEITGVYRKAFLNFDEISNHILVHPNPSSGNFSLDIPNETVDTILYFQISDLAGKIVMIKNIENKIEKELFFEFPSDLDNGFYIIKIQGIGFSLVNKILLTR